MSMLTPPGLGGKYRITGDKYPRMRRPRHRRRLVLAGTSAIVALGLAGWGTMQLIDVFSGESGKKLAAAAGRKHGCKTSSTAAMALPKPGQITVNVYNATPRGGLAKTTADELKKRGFLIGKVGNAPAKYDKKIQGAGILLGSPSAWNTALTVLGTQLKGAATKTDSRKTADVDLLLGTTFTKLNVQKDADEALATLVSAAAKNSACATDPAQQPRSPSPQPH
ncbi:MULTISPECIES: LytR C-terminal domain-containing protein [unclassified Streptomyces]|uniref:LytR C-terminal domain-containing protein n=1 Tax=unclassified Streptomyces TaxID=2593676 RepID=UPI00081EFB8F|nr:MULTISPECIES: LytR C-terminal domain-containing protein [unclassified Streptomyces]MYZ37155.1 LytR family transcriptional regulator [Streptomyces sp. SID4917]SCF89195.1 LytR cell envelope-related transcriptional attenuator [Streptomyces sp. MnatMP-M17]